MIIIRMFAFFLLVQSHAVSSELFTALADMEGLVSTELELVRHLDNYIQDEEIRLKQLRGWEFRISPS